MSINHTTIRDAIRDLPAYHGRCMALEGLFRIPLDTPLPRAYHRLLDLEERERRKYPHWSYDSGKLLVLQQIIRAIEREFVHIADYDKDGNFIGAIANENGWTP